MIAAPVNDTACLEKITERAAATVDGAEIQDVASRFSSTQELAGWIQTLPQRNDTGDQTDGPRVACDVSQRLRLPADDPNCVERSALYVAAAEIIDPEPVRQLATIDTPLGRHTFPVEDDVPVRLDPRLPRNALDAGLWLVLDPDPDDIRNLSPREAFDWIVSVAEEPMTRTDDGSSRLRNAERAFDALVAREPVPRNSLRDLAYVIEVATEAAHSFGAQGIDVVRLGKVAVKHALRPTRNAFGIRIGGLTLRPDFGVLGAIGRIGTRVGTSVAAQFVKAKLASFGLGAKEIGAIEAELRQENRTLGALAQPPPQEGTLAALTTTALLQKRVAAKK